MAESRTINIQTSDSTLERYLKQQELLGGPILYFDVQVAEANTHQNSENKEHHTAMALNADSAELPKESGTNRNAGNEADTFTQEEDMAQDTSWKGSRSLKTLRERICECQNCELGATRNKFVFGVGNPNADIVVIGEAPGAEEDAQGEPFVGRAGQLLTKILEAVQLSREEVFICNILKCRPPGNRVPSSDEVDQCEPYLYKQLQIIKPKFILALGLTAVNTLLKSKFKMADVRGKFFNYQDVRMMVTYHPAALLRNPEWKKGTWEDVQRLRTAYDEFLRRGTLPDFDSPQS